ncbi:MAG: hypothetical protein RRC34_04210 [Lentisphaeria bacterium]|nr:hypothetical protein [Lentisphaeria bacterium]
MLNRFQLCCAMFACLALLRPLFAADVKLAVIGRSDRAEILAIRDLVESELSNQPGLVILDRAELAKLLPEIELEMLVSAKGVSERRRLGNRLRADMLLFLGQRSVDGQDALTTCIASVNTGLRLKTAAWPLQDIHLQSAAEALSELVRQSVSAHANKGSQIVAVSPFLSRDLGRRYEYQTKSYQVMVEQFAGELPGRAVVEMDEARAFVQEAELCEEVRGIFAHSTPLLISGNYRNELSMDGKQIKRTTLELDFREGERVIARSHIAGTPPEIADRLRDEVFSKLRKLGGPGATAPPTDKLAEATSLWIRAHELLTWGQYADALSLLETVMLILPDDASCPESWGGVAINPSLARGTRLKDFVRHRVIGLYGTLVRVCATEPRDAIVYAEFGAAAVEQTFFSSLPPTVSDSANGFWDTVDSRLWGCWRWAGQDATLRTPMLELDKRRREALLSLYEYAAADPDRHKQWQAFVERTFEYQFPRHAHELTKKAEIDGYLNDLLRAITLLRQWPGNERRVVDGICRLVEGIQIKRVEEIDWFLKQLPLVIGEPKGPFYAEFASMYFIYRHRLTYGDTPEAPFTPWLERDYTFLEEMLPRIATIMAALKEIDAEAADAIPSRDHTLYGRFLELQRNIRSHLARVEKGDNPKRSHFATSNANGGAGKVPAFKPFEKIVLHNQSGERLYFIGPRDGTFYPGDLPHIPANAPWPKDFGRLYSWQSYDTGFDLLAFNPPGWPLLKMSREGVVEPFVGTNAVPLSGGIRDVAYDGQHFWISLGAKIVITDLQGNVMHVFSQENGLPAGDYRCGDAYGTGRTIWVGYTSAAEVARNWLVDLSFVDNRGAVDVFHEARRQRGNAATNTELAFYPQYVIAFEQAGRQIAVVGRPNYPLLVDCAKRTVEVLATSINPEGRGAYLALAPYMQVAEDENYIYWMQQSKLWGLSKRDLRKHLIMDVGKQLVEQGLRYPEACGPLCINEGRLHFRLPGPRIGWVDLAGMQLSVNETALRMENILFGTSHFYGLVVGAPGPRSRGFYRMRTAPPDSPPPATQH